MARETEADGWVTTYDSMDQILLQAVKAYGNEMQILVAIEELSELQKALTKWLRYRGPEQEVAIAEEMADVWICLHELQMIFGNKQERKVWEAYKVGRLCRRMTAEGIEVPVD